MGNDDYDTSFTISIPSIEDGSIDGLTVGGITTTDSSYSYSPSYSVDTSTMPSSITFDSNYNEFDSDLIVSEDADIKLGNKSLKEFISKMEDRLAILQPDPKKLEKFEALRKAYEHYKTVEALCLDEADDNDQETLY